MATLRDRKDIGELAVCVLSAPDLRSSGGVHEARADDRAELVSTDLDASGYHASHLQLPAATACASSAAIPVAEHRLRAMTFSFLDLRQRIDDRSGDASRQVIRCRHRAVAFTKGSTAIEVDRAPGRRARLRLRRRRAQIGTRTPLPREITRQLLQVSRKIPGWSRTGLPDSSTGTDRQSRRAAAAHRGGQESSGWCVASMIADIVRTADLAPEGMPAGRQPRAARGQARTDRTGSRPPALGPARTTCAAVPSTTCPAAW